MIALGFSLTVAAQVTPLGQGSYATQLPKDQSGNTLNGPMSPKPQPEGLVPLTAPVQTNDWWTSQVFKWSAAPAPIPMGTDVIPQPLLLLPEWDGLGIQQMHTYYWAQQQGGQGPGFKQLQCPPGLNGECWDVLVTPRNSPNFTQTSVQSYSTWVMSMMLLTGTSTDPALQVTCGRGSPYAWVELSNLPPPSDPFGRPWVEAQNVDGVTPLAAYMPPGFTTADTSASGDTSSAGQDKNVVCFTANGRNYALFGPSNAYWRWTRFSANLNTVNFYLVLPGTPTSTYVVVAALPQNLAQLTAAGTTLLTLVQQFGQYAFLKPANSGSTPGTCFAPSYDGSGTAKGTYTFNLLDLTTGNPAPGAQTLFALFPHQVAHLVDQSQILSPLQLYVTPRGYALGKDDTSFTASDWSSPHAGQMTLAKGSGFTLAYPYSGVLPPVLDKGGSWDQATMQGYLAWDLQNLAYPNGVDTYNWGKHLSRLANNYLIGQQAGWSQSADVLSALKTAMTQWFTATDGSGGMKTVQTASSPSQPPVPGLFCYDGNWGALTGYPAGFGSDQWFNDHHFHYGYFIRAAAVLAGADAQWKTDYGPMVELLIRDIAADYGDPMFPPYRCFDPYAGHSVASGVQQYADGADQESSSEAINAWYAMILWGQVTGNAAVTARGIYMYASEVDAAERYWFEEAAVTDGTFPLPSKTLADVYDGLAEYNTFFPTPPEGLHIINFLPFGGGSLYLGANRAYAAANYSALVQEKGGSTAWANYSDLIWMYRALSDGADALAQMNAGMASLAPDSGNTKAMTYHWITTVSAQGTAETVNCADHPMAMSFQDPKDGSLLYTAYSEAPVMVHFGDGHQLDHPGGGYYSESSSATPSVLGLTKGLNTLDEDDWTFAGKAGQTVSFTLADDPSGEHKGNRVTLLLKGPNGFSATRKGKVPLTLSARLPADGACTIGVLEQADSAPGNRLKGDYLLEGFTQGWSAHTMSATASVEGQPLLVTAQASPNYGFSPLIVHFSATAEGGTPPYTFRWASVDFPLAASGSSFDSTLTSSYTRTLTVLLSVRDSGNNAVIQEVHVRVLNLP